MTRKQRPIILKVRDGALLGSNNTVIGHEITHEYSEADLSTLRNELDKIAHTIPVLQCGVQVINESGESKGKTKMRPGSSNYNDSVDNTTGLNEKGLESNNIVLQKLLEMSEKHNAGLHKLVETTQRIERGMLRLENLSRDRGEARPLPSQDPPSQDPSSQDPPSQDPPSQDPPSQDTLSYLEKYYKLPDPADRILPASLIGIDWVSVHEKQNARARLFNSVLGPEEVICELKNRYFKTMAQLACPEMQLFTTFKELQALSMSSLRGWLVVYEFNLQDDMAISYDRARMVLRGIFGFSPNVEHREV